MARNTGDWEEEQDLPAGSVVDFMGGEELVDDELGPDWVAFDPTRRPKTPTRGHRSKPISERRGEWLNPETGKFEAVIDEEGYEWIVPASTSNPARPFAHAVGYNRQEKKLRVVFRDGSPASHFKGTWAYENVTGTEWYNLRRHRSTGKYMIKNIFHKANYFESFPEPW